MGVFSNWDDPKFLLLHFFLACMPEEWRYCSDWVRWPLSETDQTAWRTKLWMQKSPLCFCYWAGYICWDFLEKTSDWETVGSNRHMREWMGIWTQTPLYLNPVLSLTSCTVSDKSLYSLSLCFLWLKWH